MTRAAIPVPERVTIWEEGSPSGEKMTRAAIAAALGERELRMR
jgi:hypothetical protein